MGSGPQDQTPMRRPATATGRGLGVPVAPADLTPCVGAAGILDHICHFFHAASTAFGYSGRPRLPL
jgi:hypothetical protein